MPIQDLRQKFREYDKVSSFLVASLILAGFATVLLLILYLSQLDWSRAKAPVYELPKLAGNQSNPEGIAEDIEEPGVEELPDVAEPQLADAVEAVTSDPSSQRAAYEAVDGNMSEMGTGKGLGDWRQSGPGDGGTADYIPDWERWNIRYSSANVNEYAQQLEYFGIELGAASPKANSINYVSQFATNPVRRTGTRREDKRIFFRYNKKSLLAKWDADIMTRCGVSIREKFLLQFYPEQTRAELFRLEGIALNGKSLTKVLKTTFGVRPNGSGGFEYFVMDIKYR